MTYPHFKMHEVAYDIKWKCDVTINSELLFDVSVINNKTKERKKGTGYHVLLHRDVKALAESNGKFFSAIEHLRKKPEAGSWSQIKKIWNPLNLPV